MRRLAVLGALAGLVWWLLGRRGTEEPTTATIGYADGSAVTLTAGSPELERLVQVAAGAVPS